MRDQAANRLSDFATSTDLFLTILPRVGRSAVRLTPRGQRSTGSRRGRGARGCAEARAHGIAPVTRDHPAYPFMWDGDGDGVVCESGSRRSSPTSSPASPRVGSRLWAVPQLYGPAARPSQRRPAWPLRVSAAHGPRQRRSGPVFAIVTVSNCKYKQLREQGWNRSHSRSHNVRNVRCSARNPADAATILPHLSLPPVVDRRQSPTFAAVDRLAGSRPFQNGCPSRRRDRCRTRRCPDRA